MKFKLYFVSVTPFGHGREVPFSFEIECGNSHDASLIGERFQNYSPTWNFLRAEESEE